MERKYYIDTHNPNKIWEVVRMKGGIYLRQYIHGRQFGRGLKTSMRNIKMIGINKMKETRKI